MRWALIGRKAMLVALTSAIGSIGCSSKKEALVLFDVDVAPGVPSVRLLRFSVAGHAEIPPHEASGDPRPSHLFFGFYMPGVSGSVTVLSEALDGDNCVVGRGSATVDYVQPGKTSPDENTPKALSIDAVLPVLCDRDASTRRDAATDDGDSSTGDSRPADSNTVDSAVGDTRATDSSGGESRTGDPGGADSSVSDVGGGMGGSSGAAGQPGGMGAGGNAMA